MACYLVSICGAIKCTHATEANINDSALDKGYTPTHNRELFIMSVHMMTSRLTKQAYVTPFTR